MLGTMVYVHLGRCIETIESSIDNLIPQKFPIRHLILFYDKKKMKSQVNFKI